MVELLIVVAILGILAGVVIPNVLGLMGRGGAQAYETDQETIQLSAATFYSDGHGGWNDGGGDDPLNYDPGNPTDYINNRWGDEVITDKGHYYPTAIAMPGRHVLYMSTAPADQDPDNPGSYRLYVREIVNGVVTGNANATDDDINVHAIWMGLLVNALGVGTTPGGTDDRGDVAPLANNDELSLYLQEMPESAASGNDRNGTPQTQGGQYCWVVGEGGKVYGAYSVADKWYAGYGGGYP